MMQNIAHSLPDHYQQRMGVTPSTFTLSPNRWEESARFQRAKRGRWYLGVHSRNKPIEIMNEVYRVLKDLGFEWKCLTPYQIRCRIAMEVGSTMKIGLQLYRVHENRYLLDFRKLEGDAFLFFDLCSQLVTELNL